MEFIVTHQRPDLDAIGAAWLLRRHVHENLSVRFVNAGQPDRDLLETAAYVVDVGRAHDPLRGRFDHHHDPSLPCATHLVWNHLCARNPDLYVLRPLVEIIDAADRGLPLVAQSREVGLHAAFRGGLLGREVSDDEALAWGMTLLDGIAAHLFDRARARADLKERVVWASPDGMVAAIRDGTPQHTIAAFEEGAILVAFQAGPTTIGVQRPSETTWLHVGDRIDALEDEARAREEDDLAKELATWYRHPSGFFAGRGAAKAPREDPVPDGALQTVAVRLHRDLLARRASG